MPIDHTDRPVQQPLVSGRVGAEFESSIGTATIDQGPLLPHLTRALPWHEPQRLFSTPCAHQVVKEFQVLSIRHRKATYEEGWGPQTTKRKALIGSGIPPTPEVYSILVNSFVWLYM